jgi:hypothetical protein
MLERRERTPHAHYTAQILAASAILYNSIPGSNYLYIKNETAAGKCLALKGGVIHLSDY